MRHNFYEINDQVNFENPMKYVDEANERPSTLNVWQTGLPFAFGAAISATLTIFSFQQFLECDYFRYGYLRKKTLQHPTGYSQSQFIYLLLGVYFTPVTIVLVLTFAVQSFKGLSYISKFKLYLYAVSFLISIAACVASWIQASDVLQVKFVIFADIN